MQQRAAACGSARPRCSAHDCVYAAAGTRGALLAPSVGWSPIPPSAAPCGCFLSLCVSLSTPLPAAARRQALSPLCACHPFDCLLCACATPAAALPSAAAPRRRAAAAKSVICECNRAARIFGGRRRRQRAPRAAGPRSTRPCANAVCHCVPCPKFCWPGPVCGVEFSSLPLLVCAT